MRAAPVALLVLALAACGSPRQDCIDAANAELSTIDRLIDETEANILRGYALAPDPDGDGEGVRICADGAGPLSFCAERRTGESERPVAIDPEAERAKLAALMDRRLRLAGLAARDVAQCEATYRR